MSYLLIIVLVNGIIKKYNSIHIRVPYTYEYVRVPYIYNCSMSIMYFYQHSAAMARLYAPVVMMFIIMTTVQLKPTE